MPPEETIQFQQEASIPQGPVHPFWHYLLWASGIAGLGCLVSAIGIQVFNVVRLSYLMAFVADFTEPSGPETWLGFILMLAGFGMIPIAAWAVHQCGATPSPTTSAARTAASTGRS